MGPLLATGLSMALPAIANMIIDLVSSPSDEKANNLRATRDALAGRLAEKSNMPLEEAYQAVDQDLATAMRAAQEEGPGGVEAALNAGLAIGGAALAYAGAGGAKGMRGMFGKKGGSVDGPIPMNAGSESRVQAPPMAIAKSTEPSAEGLSKPQPTARRNRLIRTEPPVKEPIDLKKTTLEERRAIRRRRLADEAKG